MTDPAVPPPSVPPQGGGPAPSSPPPIAPGYAAPVPPRYAAPYAGAHPQHPPYAAPYAPATAAPRALGAVPPRSTRTLGLIALVASIVATFTAPVVASLAAFTVGHTAALGLSSASVDPSLDWSILAPVREYVLLGEVAFWLGTAIGVWALTQGIVATVKNAGRTLGIVAIVFAALGPLFFAFAVQISLTAGIASGTTSLG
ncbi:hypothetical protein ACFQZV_06940 [Microbacterium koreense]|uniref:Yip1 domain-containing protein n=1 Tax=Microbacterium koreense TaxID=323761 RepID=A0ABW2ZR75_9MICO